ncbi:hypothetical protein CLHUN_13830 [Ruminiclostridium hungatei]|uniref:NusG-like N-terminal domain-containing protein n=1 Tax=Ruminiclostridium hungatei TaxID=48256 RepID=A0A1V4SLS2_RUMHU|nr:antiterminator LoaP [Ruminiclostridium hungatei]OPX44829.1 hypothetical protein CLHUN_13830 [Ruminiclostridium hungatei]
MDFKTKEKWYALFVVTGEEDIIKDRLNLKMRDGLRAVVPKRRLNERKHGRWQEKLRILFPGYILLNGCIQNDSYDLFRGIPGVIRLLKDNDGPQQILQQEIENICRLTSDSEIIGYSKVCISGGKVEVIEGPLCGMEGYIRSVDKRKGRAKVILNLMSEPRIVELGVTMVKPA